MKKEISVDELNNKEKNIFFLKIDGKIILLFFFDVMIIIIELILSRSSWNFSWNLRNPVESKLNTILTELLFKGTIKH
jgi:hypothetical protein